MKNKMICLFLCVITMVFASGSTLAFPIFEESEPVETPVPIIMYHLVTEKSKYHGKFGISPSELESDLEYLQENGYTTVVVEDLIRFAEFGRKLPKKPVMLTFDDGCSSDYHHVFPLLQKYDAKAVMSVVGKLADDYSADGKNNRKPHLIWPQIKEMHKSKRVEFQNHSYDLHGGNGSGKKKGETVEAYKKRFSYDLMQAQQAFEHNLYYTPTAFAYPLGVISDGSEEALQEMGFKASFSCAEGVTTLKSDEPERLFRLKRNNRVSGSSVEKVLKKLEAGK